MKKVKVTTLLLFCMSYLVTGAVIVDQNWDDYGTYPTVLDANGITIDGITYNIYTTTGTAHAGNISEINSTTPTFNPKVLDNDNVVSGIYQDGSDKAFRTSCTSTYEPATNFQNDGMPDVSYLEIDITDDTVLKSISYNYRKTNKAYQYTGLRYTDDGGTTWKFLAEYYKTTNSANDFPHSWSGNLPGVDAIRICVWANGGSNPGYIYIDDIVIEEFETQIINTATAENSPLTDLFYNSTDGYQPVYSFNVNATDEANFYSLKDFTLADNGSTALTTDITDFKIYFAGANNQLTSSMTELATSATITPATLGNITLVTPQKIFDGDNWFIVAAKRNVSPNTGNLIKLHVPTMTLNNGADLVKVISSSTATVTVVEGSSARGLYLDGTNYVDFGTNVERQLHDQFTVEARFNVSDLSNTKTILSCNNNGSYQGLRVAVGSNGSLIFGFKASQSSNGTNAWFKTTRQKAVEINQWYHVAVTYDADGADNDILLYLNGVQLDRYEVDDAVTTGSVWDKPFRYIGYENEYGNNFIGQVDEVRVWDYARSKIEIDSKKATSLSGTEPGLLAFYNLNTVLNNSLADTSSVNLARDPQFVGEVINPTPLSTFSVVTTLGTFPPKKVLTTTLELNVPSGEVTVGTLLEYATIAETPVYHFRLKNPVDGITLESDGAYRFNPQLNPSSTVTFDYEIVEGSSTSRADGDVIATDTANLTKANLDYNWKFDGDLVDDISAEVGTVPAGATYDEDNSVYGFGLTLNGTDYVATNVNLGSGNIQYTLSAWIFPTVNPSGADRIFSDYNNELGVLLEPGDNNIRVYYGGNLETVSARLNLSEWHLITVTHDDKTLRIYQDGVEVASAPVVHNYGSNSELRIGANNNTTPGQQFYGTIDDVKIYSYALSADAVMTEYTKGTPVTGLEMTQTGNLLEWKVDSEYNVKEYQVVNIETGELIATIPAGQGPYTLTLEPGVEAKLVVVDNSGFKQAFFPENGDIVTYNYPLTAGWNLITLPTNNADLSNLERVATGDFWAWTGDSYRVANSTDSTVWVYTETPQEVLVTADKQTSDINLSQGWNLVGSLENIEAPEGAQVIYSWNSKYQQIADESAILLQGVGYWIFSF